MSDINDQILSYNKDVEDWSKKVSSKTVSRIRSLCKTSNVTAKLFKPGTNQEEPLADSFDYKTDKQYGEVDRIGFAFARHGVFVQKGVGRGYVMQNGFVTRGYKKKIGRNKHDKRTSFIASGGAINRKPVDWFNGPLTPDIENLADIVAGHYADRIINATHLKIN